MLYSRFKKMAVILLIGFVAACTGDDSAPGPSPRPIGGDDDEEQTDKRSEERFDSKEHDKDSDNPVVSNDTVERVDSSIEDTVEPVVEDTTNEVEPRDTSSRETETDSFTPPESYTLELTASQQSPTVGQSVDFSCELTPKPPAVDYTWNVDGQAIQKTGKKVEYAFDQGGTHVVQCRAKPIGRDELSDSLTLDVSEQNQLNITRISAIPSSGPAPLTVRFQVVFSYAGDLSNLTFNWTFGDGESSGDRQPSHRYEDPGDYSATLEITAPNNIASQSTPIEVTE